MVHDTPTGRQIKAAPINQFALSLFGPIAKDYERWSRILSLGQDPRWRRHMVRGLQAAAGARILDVAAGTGEVTRLLAGRGLSVISLDQSPEMISMAVRRGAVAVLGRAEALPFPDNCFDALTFTYLFRYVQDPISCLKELVRVVRPGGAVGMVEFGRPGGIWAPFWMIYTRTVLPLAGTLISGGWRRAGKFLGPSIDDLHRRFPGDRLLQMWRESGLSHVSAKHLTFGSGLVMWGQKKRASGTGISPKGDCFTRPHAK